MKRFRLTHLLGIVAAVVLLGFLTVDFDSKQASVLPTPDFTATTEVPKSEQKASPTLQDFNDAIVNIADQTNPTVVTVSVKKTVEARQNPLSRFFGNPRAEPREYQREGLGSGVIVAKEGYILTNHHVVNDADEVEVKLYNDQKYTAEVVGADPRTDIAVLKIDAPDLNVIPLGNSEKLRVGEMVLAIGSPLQAGLAHSVSMGIVSAKDRTIGILRDQAGYENFIQTDAAINPGNSGGALVDMDGELVGINSAIASRSGGNDGIGFAVPIDIAKRIMTSIIENGRVVRGFLGISHGGDVDATMAKALGLDKAHGVIVGSVQEDGPAEEAGIQEDDVIQSINGEPIKSWYAFRTKIGTSAPGTEIDFTINRDGETKEITVTLGEEPSEVAGTQQTRPDKSLDDRVGFKVRDLNPEIAQQLRLDAGQQGVVVTQVASGSSAQEQGLQQYDVITEINREPITNVSDFRSAINEAADSEDGVVLLRVIRQGNSQLVAFEL
ncbi:Do family serine endopeptidase [Fodinibius salsisoli]|uniref:Do family serine endopeptidase n=1 Tax=Fodinibius salsisoli TaxID=2820877 RepID=A0ABT3PMD5_9BACT|nr:Do family serine endopeptidase [Fodinibius salsisoli]MCW9707107.1 Do family serine endopeptidase [Fodinibius salsisoli]